MRRLFKPIAHSLKRNGHASAPVVVVSGLPRSGTSLMMQMLQAGGVPLLVDGKRLADENNPKGYYEYEPVKRMAQAGAGWMGQAAGKAVKIVSPLLLYLPPDYTYRVIFMVRPLAEVIASQARMMAPAVLDHAKAESEYAAHLDKIRAWLATQANIHTLEVAHHDAILCPQKAAGCVADFLPDWRLDTDAMRRVIEPNLYRNRG